MPAWVRGAAIKSGITALSISKPSATLSGKKTENIETLRLMRRERTGFVLPDSVEKKSGMKLNNHRFRVGKDVLTRRLI